MNRFFFDSSLRSMSVLAFFAVGVASDSALRFLGAGASSASLSSSSDEDSDVAELASLADSSSEEAWERQYLMHLKESQILLGCLLLWVQRSQACPSKPSR